MARVRKRGSGWAAEIRRRGYAPESRTFDTKAAAVQWVMMREAELTGKRLPDRTLADALNRIKTDCIPPTPAGQRWQENKLANFLQFPIAQRRLVSLTRADLADWRDARLKQVSPATVNRELNLWSAVLRECAGDWQWLHVNPMAGLSRPDDPKPRRRRITQAEIEAVCRGLGYHGGKPETPAQRVALAFLFALETAMRGGEIVRIRPAHVRGMAVHIPKSKNGDARDVPLSTRAREILALVDNHFHLTDAQRGSVFREGVRKAKDAEGKPVVIDDLHFHDSRAEAIFRLSKKLDVLELARMVGHRNIASLMIYYQTTADELAARLG